MADGAVECLEKPFSEEVLLSAVNAGFALNHNTPDTGRATGSIFGDRETHEQIKGR
jgi:FixJ family two-component response regulator